jgi:DNA-binding FadR family transcriptional regulator
MAEPPHPFVSSSRISLGEAIARELEQEITGGELEPGERLGTKEDLRVRFGVALATINEAIRLLEMRGMLTARPGPGGGVFVSQTPTRTRMNHFVMGYKWSEAAVADHHTVRNALEPLVCREAARYRRESDVRALERMVEAMEQHEPKDPLTVLRQTWALHRRIAKTLRNQPLRSIYLTMLDALEDAVARVDEVEFDPDGHIAVHRELVAAIAEGPGERLEEALRRHEVSFSFDD